MHDPKFRSVVPLLETNEFDATRDFYCDTLGFTCESFSADWGWMTIKHGDVSLMFSRPNAHRNITAPIMSGSLYIATTNIDDVWAEVRDRAEVCYPIENFEYGMREFAIYDNNGYLLQFGEPIKE